MSAFIKSIPSTMKRELPSTVCEAESNIERLPKIAKIESLAVAVSPHYNEYNTDSKDYFERVPLIIKAEPSSSDCEEENILIKTSPPSSENEEYSNDRVSIKAEPQQPPYDIQIKRVHNKFTNPKYLPKQIVIKHIESKHWNFFKLLQHCKPDIEDLLTYALMVDGQIEYSLYMNLSFNGEDPFVFSSKFINLAQPSEIDLTLEVLMELMQLEISLHEEPFWFSKEIQIYELIVNTRTRPKRSGGYLVLPMDVCNLELVLNVQNKDDFCFKWAILCATLNQSYWSVYDKVDIKSDRIRLSGQVLDFSGLKFPLEVRECQIFERNNPHISVNVFGLDGTHPLNCQIYGPLYRTRRERKLHVNLLYTEDSRINRSHYSWIRQLRQLLQKFGFPPSKYLCNTCLRHFLAASNFFLHKLRKRNCENPISIYP